MPILIEINSGRESQKTGVLPEEAMIFVEEISRFEWIEPSGLMTMGPRFGDTEKARPYFRETKRIFDQLGALKPGNLTWSYRSAGMNNTYPIAIEEGANIVRIGTRLFGERKQTRGTP